MQRIVGSARNSARFPKLAPPILELPGTDFRLYRLIRCSWRKSRRLERPATSCFRTGAWQNSSNVPMRDAACSDKH